MAAQKSGEHEAAQIESFEDTWRWDEGAALLRREHPQLLRGESMALSIDDRLAIHELVSLHGHLSDDRQFSRFKELFTDDIVYDLEDFGRGTHRGLDALTTLATVASDRGPLAHHVTNVIVTEGADGTVRVRSKGIGLMADGKVGSVVYDDVVARTADGWRIARRAVVARRAAS